MSFQCQYHHEQLCSPDNGTETSEYAATVLPFPLRFRGVRYSTKFSISILFPQKKIPETLHFRNLLSFPNIFPTSFRNFISLIYQQFNCTPNLIFITINLHKFLKIMLHFCYSLTVTLLKFTFFAPESSFTNALRSIKPTLFLSKSSGRQISVPDHDCNIPKLIIES